LGRWQDLILFVATPLLILPSFLLARSQWSVESIALFVAAFGALGHHFPGMLRAYGDRQLFRRFRLRFILAPVFLAITCAAFALHDLSGMILVAALWGVWHGMAQTYGFLRIYDSKAGGFHKATARLDFAMCVAWFGVGLILSPTRMFDLLARFYLRIGGPLIPPEVWVGLRGAWAIFTLAITAAFLIHTILRWRQGVAPSPRKIALMVTSFGFWVFCSLTVKNLLVGVALFEIFHDIQYLSITWIYNRNRAEKVAEVGSFTRFLFRRSGALIGVYIGLVFAYGSLAFVAKGLPIEPLMGGLQGVLVASALLHFYYDGFIWKMREPSTAESLGVKKVAGQQSPAPSFASGKGLGHLAKWAPFALMAGWLFVTESQGTPHTELEATESIVAALPNAAGAQNLHGEALFDAGKAEEAEQAFRRALEIRPDFAEAHNNLSLLAAERSDLGMEMRHLQEALRLRPQFPEALANLGVALAAQGRKKEAARRFREALELDQEMAAAHASLGVILAALGDLPGAEEHLEKALELEPDLSSARPTLKQVRALRSRP